MMGAPVTVRDMTDADLKALGKRVAVGAEWFGRVGERRGAIAGFCIACWYPGGPALLSFEVLTPGGRTVMLSRLARNFLRDLMAVCGSSEIRAYCDHRIRRAGAWLDWLGFEPTDFEDLGFRRWRLNRVRFGAKFGLEDQA